MREYLKDCYENGRTTLTVFGYVRKKSKGIVTDVVDMEKGKYICGHVCQFAYSVPVNTYAMFKAEIYPYTRSNGTHDFGLKNLKTIQYFYIFVLGDKLVYIPKEYDNIWRYSRPYHCYVPYNYHRPDGPFFVDRNLNDYNYEMLHKLYMEKNDPNSPNYDIGYRIIQESPDNYVLYYPEKNSRIIAYKSPWSALNAYLNTHQEVVEPAA